MTIIEVACLAPWQDRSVELNELIRSAPEHCRIKLAPQA